MPLPTENEARKALPIFTWLTEYFPDAIVELVKVSVAGNEQHNPGEPLHWARGKSMNQLDTAFRHMWDHKLGAVRDTDGQYHLAKTAWRALAALQLQIEADRGTQGLVAEMAPAFDRALRAASPIPLADPAEHGRYCQLVLGTGPVCNCGTSPPAAKTGNP